MGTDLQSTAPPLRSPTTKPCHNHLRDLFSIAELIAETGHGSAEGVLRSIGGNLSMINDCKQHPKGAENIFQTWLSTSQRGANTTLASFPWYKERHCRRTQSKSGIGDSKSVCAYYLSPVQAEAVRRITVSGLAINDPLCVPEGERKDRRGAAGRDREWRLVHRHGLPS
jgi:hypothetical protein